MELAPVGWSENWVLVRSPYGEITCGMVKELDFGTCVTPTWDNPLWDGQGAGFWHSSGVHIGKSPMGWSGSCARHPYGTIPCDVVKNRAFAGVHRGESPEGWSGSWHADEPAFRLSGYHHEGLAPYGSLLWGHRQSSLKYEATCELFLTYHVSAFST